jgi:hypothetical protein
MSDELNVEDRVALTGAKLNSLDSEWKRAFQGTLTIVAISGDMIRLSNGMNVGKCRLTCSKNHVRKIN